MLSASVGAHHSFDAEYDRTRTITVTGSSIKAGTVRGLGVTSKEPWPALPEVPPIAAALPGFEVRSWIGIAAPAGTPPDVVARLNAAIGKALQSQQVKDQLGTLGVAPEPTSPERMRDFVAGEIARWQDVIAKAGVERQ